MKWRLITDGSNSGKYNMELDFRLASECRDNEAYIRFYRWNPYTISLGANQLFDEIDLEKASADFLDVVKRPTGGRAILHAEELTYSVVLPLSYGLSPKQIYHKISAGIIRGLFNYNACLGRSELESLQPDFPALLKDKSGSLCFASTAKNEVKFGHKKLIGSAQRKLKNIILQHGSILCGTYHKKLVDYIKCDNKKRIELSKELDDKTTEIETVLDEKIDYDKLIEAMINGFETELQVELHENYMPV